jgi:UDP-3-O-[3-hydroxymyristoyl] glucosamine N-acyltransferase
MLLSEIAQKIDAKMLSKDNPHIEQLAPLEHARAGAISFLARPEFEYLLASCQASAIIVAEQKPTCPIPQILHPHPYLAFVKLANLMIKEPSSFQGISELSQIAASAQLGEGCTVHPRVTIADGVSIGKRCTFYPGVYIGEGVKIGDDCTLFANVVVYHGCIIGHDCRIHAGAVIGSDGFGYIFEKDETIKIPQVGTVEIGNHVEIGANSTVDRATLGVTRIGHHTKLDSQVQIAHNCEIGERCMFSAFSGTAGSTKVKDRVTVGGNTGINGHITIGADIRIGAMSGVVSSLDEPGDYVGFPAVEVKLWRKQAVYLKRIEAMDKRIRELEKSAKS